MIEITRETILSAIDKADYKLKSTHKKLCLPIIRRIYLKMVNGIRFDAIKVCEGLIIDGHHRHISALLAQVKIDEVPSHKTNATITYNWKDVIFAEEEWDTEDKIKNLNEIDALFNGIPVDRIIELTK